MPEFLLRNHPVGGVTEPPEVFTQTHAGAKGFWREGCLQEEVSFEEEPIISQ